METLVKKIIVPAEQRKKTTLARNLWYDILEIYDNKVVGYLDGNQTMTWYFKEYTGIDIVKANMNSQLLVQKLEKHLKITKITMLLKLRVLQLLLLMKYLSSKIFLSKASLHKKNLRLRKSSCLDFNTYCFQYTEISEGINLASCFRRLAFLL